MGDCKVKGDKKIKSLLFKAGFSIYNKDLGYVQPVLGRLLIIISQMVFQLELAGTFGGTAVFNISAAALE